MTYWNLLMLRLCSEKCIMREFFSLYKHHRVHLHAQQWCDQSYGPEAIRKCSRLEMCVCLHCLSMASAYAINFFFCLCATYNIRQ